MEVGLYDAKPRLTQLIDWAHEGEDIVLTRYGKPVARIVPISQLASEEQQQPKEPQACPSDTHPPARK